MPCFTWWCPEWASCPGIHDGSDPAGSTQYTIASTISAIPATTASAVRAGCRGIPRGDDTGAPGHTTVQPPAIATGIVCCTSTLRRNRDFTKLWIGEAVSTLGSRNSYVAYPLLV